MATILVIDDDLPIRHALTRGLVDHGHVVSSAATGFGGLQEAIDNRPDLVLLDMGLPDVDGQEVLQMIRAVTSIPVIVATARDDDQAVIKALDAGADDYLVKPFSVAQLEARTRAVLRRAGLGGEVESIRVGELVIDTAAREVRLGARELELSAKEFDLLTYLAGRVGRVVTRRELMAQVWQQPYGAGDRTVDVHLSWLRRKLGESASSPRYVLTVRGVGVKLVAP